MQRGTPSNLPMTRGLVLSPYQNRRWDSDFRTVQKVVAEGALGTVTRFESRFERWAPERGPGRSGGGTLRDFGSHLMDQALVLLGPAVSVYAEWRMRDSGLDDDIFVAVTHANGARSHLMGSWSQSSPGPRYRVTGTQGTYVLGPADTQEDLLLAGDTPATLGDRWGVEPPDTSRHAVHRHDLRAVPDGTRSLGSVLSRRSREPCAASTHRPSTPTMRSQPPPRSRLPGSAPPPAPWCRCPRS